MPTSRLLSTRRGSAAVTGAAAVLLARAGLFTAAPAQAPRVRAPVRDRAPRRAAPR